MMLDDFRKNQLRGVINTAIEDGADDAFIEDLVGKYKVKFDTGAASATPDILTKPDRYLTPDVTPMADIMPKQAIVPAGSPAQPQLDKAIPFQQAQPSGQIVADDQPQELIPADILKPGLSSGVSGSWDAPKPSPSMALGTGGKRAASSGAEMMATLLKNLDTKNSKNVAVNEENVAAKLLQKADTVTKKLVDEKIVPFLSGLADKINNSITEEEKNNEQLSQKVLLDAVKNPSTIADNKENITRAFVSNIALSAPQTALSLIPYVGVPIMTATEGGNWSKQAQEMGVVDTDILREGSLGYGIPSAIIETYTNKIVAAPFGGKANPITTPIVKALSKYTRPAFMKIAKPIMEMMGAGGFEGSEEFLQGNWDKVVTAMAVNKQRQKYAENGNTDAISKLDAKYNDYLKSINTTDAAILGALAGAGMHTGTQIIAKSADIALNSKTSTGAAPEQPQAPGANLRESPNAAPIKALETPQTPPAKPVAAPSATLRDLGVANAAAFWALPQAAQEEARLKLNPSAIAEIDSNKPVKIETKPDTIQKPVESDKVTPEAMDVLVDKAKIENNTPIPPSSPDVKPEANIDRLTDLPNSNASRENIEIDKKDPSKKILFFDIDNFKSVNEMFGHDGGDDVLRALGQLIKVHFEGAKYGRVGGEEFYVSLPEGGDSEAKVREFLHDVPQSVKIGNDEPITISGGFAPGTVDLNGKASLAADVYLKKAKEAGKNQIISVDKSGKIDYINGREGLKKPYVEQYDLRAVAEGAKRLLGKSELSQSQRSALERAVQALAGDKSSDVQGETPGAAPVAIPVPPVKSTAPTERLGFLPDRRNLTTESVNTFAASLVNTLEAQKRNNTFTANLSKASTEKLIEQKKDFEAILSKADNPAPIIREKSQAIVTELNKRGIDYRGKELKKKSTVELPKTLFGVRSDKKQEVIKELKDEFPNDVTREEIEKGILFAILRSNPKSVAEYTNLENFIGRSATPKLTKSLADNVKSQNNIKAAIRRVFDIPKDIDIPGDFDVPSRKHITDSIAESENAFVAEDGGHYADWQKGMGGYPAKGDVSAWVDRAITQMRVDEDRAKNKSSFWDELLEKHHKENRPLTEEEQTAIQAEHDRKNKPRKPEEDLTNQPEKTSLKDNEVPSNTQNQKPGRPADGDKNAGVGQRPVRTGEAGRGRTPDQDVAGVSVPDSPVSRGLVKAFESAVNNRLGFADTILPGDFKIVEASPELLLSFNVIRALHPDAKMVPFRLSQAADVRMGGLHGVYLNRHLYINVDSRFPFVETLTHETVHDWVNSLSNAERKVLLNDYKGTLNDKGLERLAKVMAFNKTDKEEIALNEMLTEHTTENLGDASFWKRLWASSPTAARKLIVSIFRAFQKVNNYFNSKKVKPSWFKDFTKANDIIDKLVRGMLNKQAGIKNIDTIFADAKAEGLNGGPMYMRSAKNPDQIDMFDRVLQEDLFSSAKTKTAPLEQTSIAGFAESADKVAIEAEKRKRAEQAAAENTGTADLPIFNNNEVARAEDSQGNLFGKKETPAPTGEIKDFGQKIGGAKKDTWQSYKDKMTDAGSVDITTEPLAKSWPEPDYQKLIDDGADSWTVAFIHSVRDEVPRKPIKPWRLKNWGEHVKQLRDMSVNLLDGTLSKDKARDGLLKAGNLSRGMQDIIGRIELYETVGHGKSLADISLNVGSYGMYDGVKYDTPKTLWTVDKKVAATSYSNWPKQLSVANTKEEAIKQFKEKYAALEMDAPANKQVSFDIYSKYGTSGYFVGKKVGRNYIDLAGPFEKLFLARKHKIDNHDQLVAKLEKAKEIPNVRRDTNNPRVGEDMRAGQDVTPQMFSDAFGFKGVEFGNWVEQKKRQADLNDAYDALMDMAAVIGVNPKAISLNGELGMAFGARGTGGRQPAKAHYEPGHIVINLTKKDGAGSLAHEWWHSVDSYFSRMRGKNADYMSDALDVSLASRGSDFVSNTAVRKEMVSAFGRVIASIRRSALETRSKVLDKKRSEPYWATTIEMAARSFESYIISKLEDQNASNDYLANIVSPEAWKASEKLGMELEDSYPYPNIEESPSVREAFDSFFNTVETKETDKGVAMFSRPEDAEYEFNTMLSDGADVVLNEFKSGYDKQPWKTIPYKRLKKIWNDFNKYGFVRDEVGIDEMQNIIMLNVSKLQANTYLAGHDISNPSEEFEKHGIDSVNQDRFYDYIGSGISDYGMRPLLELTYQLVNETSYEKKLLTIDRLLNVVHQRGDLASFFVEGGSSALSGLSARPSDIDAPLFSRPYFDETDANSVNERITEVQAMRDKVMTEGLPLFMREPVSQEELFKDRDDAKKKAKLNSVYAEVLSKKLKPITKSRFSGIGSALSGALTPISTRLKNINPALKNRLREFEYTIARNKRDYRLRIKDLLDKKKKVMSSDDAIIFDFAEKNRDIDKINELTAKYNLTEEYAEKRKVLNELWGKADEVGFDAGYLYEYSPRSIINPDGLLGYMRDLDGFPSIQKIINDESARLGRPLATEEIAALINKSLRGFPVGNITLSKPSNLKEREIDIITPEINQYYDNSDSAMLKYIDSMVEAIEARKFFGKTAIIEDGKLILDKSIGAYVADLLANGKINIGQDTELAEMLMARFKPGHMSGVLSVFRDIEYLDTMGSPMSALTQIQDLGFSLANNGVINTLRVIGQQHRVSMEDIGVEKIAQEFSSASKSSKVLEKVFKMTGFSAMDRLGKTVMINSSLNRARSMAKYKPEELKKELEPIFGNETDALINDLNDGNITENVKLYLFNKLLDVQPIALSEMPEYYLKSGNGRIFYMLKTFQLRQMDVFRVKVYDELRAGNKKEAFKNLVVYAGFLVAFGATSNLLKDLLSGRPVDPEKETEDAFFSLMGLSRYVMWQAREEGLGWAFTKLVSPPYKLLDSAIRDINNQFKDKPTNAKDLEIWASVPLVGKMYYWWFGKGHEKSEKRRADMLAGKVEGADNEQAVEFRKNFKEAHKAYLNFKSLVKEKKYDEARAYKQQNMGAIGMFTPVSDGSAYANKNKAQIDILLKKIKDAGDNKSAVDSLTVKLIEVYDRFNQKYKEKVGG